MATREDRIKSYNNFVKIRKEKKILTDLEIAKRAGMSPSSFTDWKNGRSQPNAIHMLMIAKALRISPAKLIV